MPRKWKSRLWILPALLLISSLLAFAVYDGLSGLTTSHRQFQTLSSFYRLDYAEMIKVIGPPDVDEGVKGIVEWHSLNDENVSFGVDYVPGKIGESRTALRSIFRHGTDISGAA